MKLNTNDYVNLFKEEYNLTFFQSSGTSYVSALVNNKDITYKINSKQLQDLLRMCLRKNKINITTHQMKEILMELDSLAFESETNKTVFIRNGHNSNKTYYIDTCNDGKFIRIEANQWSIVNNCSLPFFRPAKQAKLPLPIQTDLETFIKKFKDKWNLIHPDNYILILTALINALKSDSESFIITIFEGEQGQGKTTASRYVKRLIDPTIPQLNATPNSIEELSAIINSSYLIAIDNSSFIKNKIADIFCIISTGGGFSLRELYTTNDEVTFNIQRPLLLNGINGVTSRPDALDRMIINECGGLDVSTRKSDTLLEQRFTEDYPLLLGGLYTLFSKVLHILPTITHSNLPRMANFARLGIAIEKVLNLQENFFLDTYNKNIKYKSENAFWDDDLCSIIFENLENRSIGTNCDQYIEGTSTTILKEIRKKHKSFSPNGHFGNHLKRVEPLLRERGIIVERLPRTSRARLLRIKFTDEALKQLQNENKGDQEKIELRKVLFKNL